MRNVATAGKRYGRGLYYNWYAVDNARGLAPDGWRVPSHSEWTDIITHVGDYTSGGEFKSLRLEWQRPNTGATNSTGFEALPVGYIITLGPYYVGSGEYASFWASDSPTGSSSAYYRRFLYNSEQISGEPDGISTGYTQKSGGLSVRCIQDKDGAEQDGNIGTLKDIDGNEYTWIVIGPYRVMRENLRTRRYKDITFINFYTWPGDFVSDTEGGCIMWQNDPYTVYPPNQVPYEIY